jgi:lysophospholipase L1-like esterase
MVRAVRRDDINWLGIALVAMAVAVIAWTAYLLAGWPPEPPSSGLAAQQQPAGGPPSAPETGTAETVLVVLGDAFSADTPGNSGPEWPQLVADELGWTVHVEAVPGSGFLTDGQGRAFSDRVGDVAAHDPAVVLVAGGFSDIGGPAGQAAEVAEAVVDELSRMVPEASVVLLSPFSNGTPGPLTRELTDRLRRAARAGDVAFVDVTGVLPRGEDLLGPDGIHPTDAGHRRIAEKVVDDLRSLPVG